MRENRPSLAFAGAGLITVVHGMAAAMASLPVAAVASRTPERAEERAGQLGARACRYDELPAGADAVVVATPPGRHVADAVAALEAGAAVLVEKPLATTLAAADELVDVAARTGRPVVYGENLLFSPVVDLALAHVDQLGALTHLSLRALQTPPDWGGFLTPEWGGGVLFDLGVHPLALALAVAGHHPERVSAHLEAGPGLEVDDLARVELEFPGGLRATVECSWRHPDVEWDLQAASASGVVRLDLQPEVALERDGEPVTLPPTRQGADPRIERLGYVDQLRALAAAVAGTPSACDAVLGRRVLDVVAGAYASAGTGGRPVDLPFTGARDRTPLELWRD